MGAGEGSGQSRTVSKSTEMRKSRWVQGPTSQRVLLEWKDQGGALGDRAHVGLKYHVEELGLHPPGSGGALEVYEGGRGLRQTFN